MHFAKPKQRRDIDMEGMPIANEVILFEIKMACTNWQFMEFQLIGGSIEPADLGRLQVPKLDSRKGVIISGRGPVWLHSFLAHCYHFHPFVAHYDPRQGGVVVQAHQKGGPKVGYVIDVQF
jgi:CRISPR-associated protein Csx3